MPKQAAWLAEYLHELTAFPKGKHDDQVDSTAQMLDWFKRAGGDGAPTTNAGVWYYYKELRSSAGRSSDRPARAAVGDGEEARYPPAVMTGQAEGANRQPRRIYGPARYTSAGSADRAAMTAYAPKAAVA